MNEAAARFGLDADNFKKLGDFENYVFEAYKQGEACILRLTHSSHRSEEAVQAELHWIRFLTQQGVLIPGCYESLNGRLTEVIPASSGETYFIAVLFQKANGERPDPRNPDVWNSELFREWGRLTGHMHRVTATYAIPQGAPRRNGYFDEGLHAEAPEIVGPSDSLVLDRLHALMAHLQGLSKDSSCYGLIHSDIHPGNFFVDGKRIMVFDFDDSAYTWFIHDIAIPLYYTLSWSMPESYGGDVKLFATDYVRAFWAGYQTEYPLDPSWLDELPYFLRLRDLELFLVFTKKVDPATMNDRVKNWLAEIRDRIERDVPIVELDFRRVIAGE